MFHYYNLFLWKMWKMLQTPGEDLETWRDNSQTFWVYIVRWCFIITIYSCERCGKCYKRQENIKEHGQIIQEEMIWYILLDDVPSLQFIPVKNVENATHTRRRLRNIERDFIFFWVYIVRWCFIITIYSCKRCGKYCKHQEEIKKHEKRSHKE